MIVNSKKILALCGIFLILLIAFFILKAPIVEKGIFLGSVQDEPAGEITGDFLLQQYFVCQEAGLQAVEIRTAAYGRRNTGTIDVALADSDTGEYIATQKIDAESISDNQFYRVAFPAQTQSKFHHYVLSISSETGIPGNAVTVWETKRTLADNLAGRVLLINGVDKQNVLVGKMIFSGKNYQKIWMPSYLLLIILLLCAKKYITKHFLPIVIGVTTLFFSAYNPIYSPIDEVAHFAYINYLIDKHTLPLFDQIINYNVMNQIVDAMGNNIGSLNIPQYEVIHPPLYYMLMAFLTFWISNLEIRLVVIRMLGGGMLVLTALIINKFIKKSTALSRSTRLLQSLSFLVLLTPGVIVRSTTASNEPLMILLVTVLIYKLAELWQGKMVVWRDGMSNGLLAALCLLTKFSAWFVVAIAFIILLWRGRKLSYLFSLKLAGLAGMFLVLLLGPWLLFNWHHYHNIIPIQQHIALVKSFANPANEPITIKDNIAHIGNFLFSFWFPQEKDLGIFRSLVFLITSAISVILILVTIIRVKTGIMLVIKQSMIKLETNLSLFMAFLVAANVISLVAGSMTTRIDVLLGRHAYICILPIITLLADGILLLMSQYAVNLLIKANYVIPIIWLAIYLQQPFW